MLFGIVKDFNVHKLSDDLIQIFSKRCFSAQTFSDMRYICAPAAAKLGFSFFEYARVYNDNTACILYSDHAIANYVVRKEFHISAHVPQQILDTEFWFMPESSGPYSQVVKDIKCLFNVGSVANYIRRHVGFYEMYSFWREEDQNIAINKFINMKESLELYCRDFYNQAENLILSVDKDRFKLTETMLPNFQGLNFYNKIGATNLALYLDKVRYELCKLNDYIYPMLSPQELKCIYLLIEGKTAANIAELLNLSLRTVEMHLNSIKLKINCQKKSDIIGTLISLAKNISMTVQK
jgi:DNA-binding CsgD family transcriptional regulator